MRSWKHPGLKYVTIRPEELEPFFCFEPVFQQVSRCHSKPILSSWDLSTGHSQSLLGSSHTRRTFGSKSYKCPNKSCFSPNQPNTKDGSASQLLHDSAPKSPWHFNKLLWPLKSHTDHFFGLTLLKAILGLPDFSWEPWRALKNQKNLTTRGRNWNLILWQKPIQLMCFESPLAQEAEYQCMSEIGPCQS